MVLWKILNPSASGTVTETSVSFGSSGSSASPFSICGTEIWNSEVDVPAPGNDTLNARTDVSAKVKVCTGRFAFSPASV